MFGGGGFDPRKMQQMMEQFGIDLTELDAEEIVITTPDEQLVFENVEVQRMDAQGQETYMINGSPESRPRTSGDDASADESDDSEGAIPDSDVEIVAQRAGVSEADAREALEATDGDLAAAIAELE